MPDCQRDVLNYSRYQRRLQVELVFPRLLGLAYHPVLVGMP